MTPAQRFAAWRLVVIGTVGCDVAFAATGWLAPAVLGTMCLIAMAALLATTPADAIRLPRARSEWIIVGAYALVAAIATRGDPTRATVAGTIGVVAIGALWALRSRDLSAWWVAVVFWQPACVAIVRSAFV